MDASLDPALRFTLDPRVSEARPRLERADEHAWIRAAQGGERAAFGRLYRLYARMVHGVLLCRVPAAEADDLTQEVFVQAWTRLSSLRDPAAFGGWLAAIARRRAADFLRARRPTVPVPENLAARPSVEAETLAVLSVLRTLPDAYRETLALRLIEGLSGSEIAAQTGLTEGSVRVNLHRGIRLLRERLGAKATGDDGGTAR